MGLGGVAIGGTWTISAVFTDWKAIPASYGQADDAESIRAIHRALELGIHFFDTAANYGAGHSERLLGQAVGGRRDEVVIATKFGYLVDEAKRAVVENNDVILENIRQDCEASLRRLGTDYIDLYQFHVAEYPAEKADAIREELEKLVAEGKIRCYGWSTSNPARAGVFAEGPNCAAIQYKCNLLERAAGMLALCEGADLASVVRGPLASGLLTGKYNGGSQLAQDDIRSIWWDLKRGREAEQLNLLDALREVLTQDGRTLAQAALGWLWALSDGVIPIPGFRTVQQVEELGAALELGPLTEAQMQEIDQILYSERPELAPVPCTLCGDCLPCPKGVDVPHNFYLHYVIGQGGLEYARNAYSQMPEGSRAGLCDGCQECEEKCPQPIQIGEWMPRIHHLLADK